MTTYCGKDGVDDLMMMDAWIGGRGKPIEGDHGRLSFASEFGGQDTLKVVFPDEKEEGTCLFVPLFSLFNVCIAREDEDGGFFLISCVSVALLLAACSRMEMCTITCLY